jgi:hypothetical protein
LCSTTDNSWRKNSFNGRIKEQAFKPEIAFGMKNAEGKKARQNQNFCTLALSIGFISSRR